jgi:ubiquinone/menaquinone biosynthesis C-methylase UbiE
MSGVRMGERLLQIGVDTPVVTGLLASKPGISGESSIVLSDEAAAAQARRAVAETSAHVNIGVHPLNALPYPDGSFDLIVIHNRNRQTLSDTSAAATLRECRRVVRSGGRVVVIDRGTPSGLAALFQGRSDPGQSEATVKALQSAGFRAVRMLGDRDGCRFTEGLHVAA